MKEEIVYEYVVAKDYFSGLDKTCRLYYDFDTKVYVYHTENQWTNKNDLVFSTTSEKRTVSATVEVVNKAVADGLLVPGPEIGVLEPKEIIPEKALEEPVEVKRVKAVKVEKSFEEWLKEDLDGVYATIESLYGTMDKVYFRLDDRFGF